MNQTIDIRWQGDRWIVVKDGKNIMSAKTCRGCLVRLVTKAMMKSTIYQYLAIYNKEGQLEKTQTIGAAHAGTSKEDS